MAEVGYIAFFNRSKQGLLEDFNAFVAEWRGSEEYKDYIRRIKSFDGSNYSEPELTSLKDGLPVTVGYCELSFPRSFPDAENGEARGFDMEPLKRWAFARGYSLKMTGTSYEDMEQGTRIGNYDIGVGYIGDCYAEESRKAGVLTSSSFSESSLQVCVKSRDGIAVTGDIDKL